METPEKGWRRFPIDWVQAGLLRKMRWGDGGSSFTAALMVLMPMIHRASEEDGTSRLTYDDLMLSTGLSRVKISDGLSVLKDLKIITEGELRSLYQLRNWAPMSAGKWAMFPAKRMYSKSGEIVHLKNFSLRSRAELNALKLFYLLAAFRDKRTNRTNIGYSKITEHSGIERNHVKTAISLLIENAMIYTELKQNEEDDEDVGRTAYNSYRIRGIGERRQYPSKRAISQAAPGPLMSESDVPF